jgi:hypothetical protein
MKIFLINCVFKIHETPLIKISYEKAITTRNMAHAGHHSQSA